MLSVSVKDNIKQFEKQMSRFAKRQLPFVASRTLNQCAKHVRQDAINKTFKQGFKSANASRFAKGVLRMKFSHKRVYAVYDGTRTAYRGSGENWFGQRIIVENDYGRNISTSLIDNNTTLRSSFKVAALTDTGSGKLYIQQVQIAGDA